ncbi:hypothetical protein [Sulfuracidifex tepidarius]|uniref:Uncharacterized protein n=1 Tax=Sulfuracidifex tepidarius TaxID=1294262 RepID=A0A510DTT1_9CREN|nr:hypothetical protein [Sulfuracidifex tepidarius]BBG23470.1 hypothetical protein IC006_0754 [Sulfuracidifex tepidarius]BBG26223.1 hypothetical protein IC007_0728 [Sulfuracidifex tepidarius]
MSSQAPPTINSNSNLPLLLAPSEVDESTGGSFTIRGSNICYQYLSGNQLVEVEPSVDSSTLEGSLTFLT